ncbi:MAG: Omp28-related outer membrane protein [Bacteroidia bacterium]
MKKLILVAALFIITCSGSYAQYYYIPHTNNPAQNPGGINTDAEYPSGSGLPAGWVLISAATNPVPVWGAVQTIPFPFIFNGAAVTQFMVSSSAILTFDVATAVPAPAYAKAALPSASIPDNSVCIWGLASLGTNDYMVSKTFGTTPNRQLWIQFSSYGYGASASSGSQFAYWSMVLEETSDKIYIVDNRTGGYATTKKVSAGIQINATTAYSIVGSPDLLSLAGTDPSPADNQYYEFIQGAQPAIEAGLIALNIQQYIVTPGSVTIGGTLTNNGAAAINTITIKYETGGNVYTDVQTGLNVTFPQSYTFTHATPLSISNPQLYPVKVWIELSGDGNQINDTLNADVHGLTFLPSKKVVIEEATGTWCGWCPRGTVYMDSIKGLYPNTTELVAVHNNDPMEVSVYDAGMGALIGGYPSGLVDRKDVDIDPLDFIDSYLERLNDVPPCDISVTANFDAVTRDIDIVVSAHFATDLTGDFRLNAVVVEEDVTGTGDGTNANNADYDQVNYYSFQSNNLALQGAGLDWQAETNPVLATTMHYDHVAREIAAGWDGDFGSLPATIAANATHSYSFTYNLPVGYDESQVHVSGWITDFSTGHILNANHGDLILGIDAPQAITSFDAVILGSQTENAKLKVTLKNSADLRVALYDATGNMLMLKDNKLAAGEYVYNLRSLELASGVYLIKVSAGNEMLTKRFSVVK